MQANPTSMTSVFMHVYLLHKYKNQWMNVVETKGVTLYMGETKTLTYNEISSMNVFYQMT